MVNRFNPVLWAGVFVFSIVLSGCAARQVDMRQVPVQQGKEAGPAPDSERIIPVKNYVQKPMPAVKRVITDRELRNIERKDPNLYYRKCLEILARFNGKDKEYIRADIKRRRPLLVPRDFAGQEDWTPLPATLCGVERIPKLILVVKDISFLGWYEHGHLVGSTYACIGKLKTWTKRGTYRVKAKDPDHISTYLNAYGEPALMPMALHIYGRVWIHAGDVNGRNCSHGCINVPIFTADTVYNWADIGTVVLITESMKDLGRDISASLSKHGKKKAKPAKARQGGAEKNAPQKSVPRQALEKTGS